MNNQYLVPFLLIAMGLCNLGFIVALYVYEGKIKDLAHNLNAMTRRLHIAKQAVIDVARVLDEDNEALKAQLEKLKAELAESDGSYWAKMYHDAIRTAADKKLQYESSAYSSGNWEEQTGQALLPLNISVINNTPTHNKEIYGDVPYVNSWDNTKKDQIE